MEMQASWQENIDASISSTVNLPESATTQDVIDVYNYAWRCKLKGITVYRDKSMRSGVLTKIEEEKEGERNVVICPECGTEIELFSGGCSLCRECGYSPCR